MKENKASCDGGGGALGHPKIFINLDKPQICWCTYCGIPFVGHPLVFDVCMDVFVQGGEIMDMQS